MEPSYGTRDAVAIILGRHEPDTDTLGALVPWSRINLEGTCNADRGTMRGGA